jgi:hypothetical protein
MSARVKVPARRLAIASATACVLLLVMDGLHVVPSWLQWAASPLALIGALVVLAVAELGWGRALSAAQAAGLVASDDRRPQHERIDALHPVG